MFGKLFKYDIKAIGKWYLGLLGVTALVSAITGASFGAMIRESSSGNIQETTYAYAILLPLLILILVSLVIATTIATYTMITRHFYRDIYSRRGYLTMTLPVSSHSIIWSKFLVAFLLFVLTNLALFLSFILFVVPFIPWNEVSLVEFWNSLVDLFSYYDFNALLLQWTLGGLIGTATTILMIYFAASLGQLFSDHRVLMAFVSYFGLLIVSWFISLVIQLPFGGWFGNPLANTLFARDGNWALSQFVSILTNLVIAGGCYFGTHYIMTKKLNLE